MSNGKNKQIIKCVNGLHLFFFFCVGVYSVCMVHVWNCAHVCFWQVKISKAYSNN